MKGGDTMHGIDVKVMGEKLKKLRGKKSQTEVAKSLGISTSAVSMYELGMRIPRDEVKIKYADYYGKTVQHIFFK